MKFLKVSLFLFIALFSLNFFSTGNFLGVAKAEAYAFSNTLGSPWSLNPTSAILGKPLTFTSNLQIYGWTGNSFPGGFEIATGPGGSGKRTVISSNPYPIPAMETYTSPKTMTSVSYTFNDAVGMHSVRSCVDVSLDQFVNQSDNDGNCSRWTDVIVTESLMPDLQAQSSSQYHPVTVGDSYPVAAGFANTGTGGSGGTGKTGPALVQTALGFDSSGNPTNLVDQKFLYWMTGLTPNESLPLRFNEGGNAVSGVPFNAAIKLPASLDGSTFPENNKFYFRVCVDKASAEDVNGIVSESDETNNCTGWNSQIVCPVGTVWKNACVVPLPSVSTSPVTNIVATSAQGTGTIISNGGKTITEAGIVWSTASNPTVSSNLGINRGGWAVGGPWSPLLNMTGLTANTTYHVRAYASNDNGVTYAYGNDVSFTTILPNNICANDSDNYPTCTTKNGICLNGATNPPLCKILPNNICANSADNYPTCTTKNGICLNGATNPYLCTIFPDGTSCSDGKMNGDETGVDCGGRCLSLKSCPKNPPIIKEI